MGLDIVPDFLYIGIQREESSTMNEREAIQFEIQELEAELNDIEFDIERAEELEDTDRIVDLETEAAHLHSEIMRLEDELDKIEGKN